MDDKTAPPPKNEGDKTGEPRALRAGMCLRSVQTGRCYRVGHNLTIFTSDYSHIHPNFILAREIRDLMREGELYIDECAPEDAPDNTP